MPVKRQLAFDLGHRPAFDRDDFLVAPCNAEAVAQIDLWPDWTGHAFAIYGAPGCGKSHLAHVYALRTEAIVLMPGEIVGSAVADLVEQNKSLVIKDGESIPDSRALLHLFNAMKERGGHLLLTSCEPPSRWPVTLPDLKSRLAAVHAVRIDAPDDAMIEAVLVKLFADRQLSVSPDILSYIVRRMDRSFAAARRTVELADTESLAGKRPITVPLIKVVLGAATGE